MNPKKLFSAVMADSRGKLSLGVVALCIAASFLMGLVKLPAMIHMLPAFGVLIGLKMFTQVTNEIRDAENRRDE